MIRRIVERTMAKIGERVELEISVYNIIYEEIQEAAKIILDSK